MRNLAWLDPQKIKEKPDVCEKQLKLCLQFISSAGRVRENKCDRILSQFRDFAVMCKTSEDDSQWPTGAHSRLDTGKSINSEICGKLSKRFFSWTMARLLYNKGSLLIRTLLLKT